MVNISFGLGGFARHFGLIYDGISLGNLGLCSSYEVFLHRKVLSKYIMKLLLKVGDLLCKELHKTTARANEIYGFANENFCPLETKTL